ncbi:hypothetical protein [Chitinivorax sp. B]|uniref:hypothetical protein n=1 Tax=Chitinivorax sp. B TaxID=2502235 RepID=UPI0010F62552|nr:hypothetical protein [Chitinivorax sp. B]
MNDSIPQTPSTPEAKDQYVPPLIGDDQPVEDKAASSTKCEDTPCTDKTMSAPDHDALQDQDAAAVKREADYAVATERCNTLTGDAKSRCIKEAKARHTNA